MEGKMNNSIYKYGFYQKDIKDTELADKLKYLLLEKNYKGAEKLIYEKTNKVVSVKNRGFYVYLYEGKIMVVVDTDECEEAHFTDCGVEAGCLYCSIFSEAYDSNQIISVLNEEYDLNLNEDEKNKLEKDYAEKIKFIDKERY